MLIKKHWLHGLMVCAGTALVVSLFLLTSLFDNRIQPSQALLNANNIAADAVVGDTPLYANFGDNAFKDVNGKVFVTARHNIYIYNTEPSGPTVEPDVILGSSSFLATRFNTAGGTTASTFKSPTRVYSTGTKLIIPDETNNRVLIYNTIPTSNAAAADVVLGQPDFTSATANNGGIDASTLFRPKSVWVVGTKLIVADSFNSRVLIWNTIPTTNNVDADIVLGQPNFTSNTGNNGGRTAHSLNAPSDATSDGTRLFVADMSNSRVLIFNTIPAVSTADADLVLGASNFTTAGAAGPTQTSVGTVGSVVSDGTHVFIGDSANNRVLIHTAMPTVNNEAADLVLGQANFTTGTAGSPTANSVRISFGKIFADGTKLFMGDQSNGRVLIHNTYPTTNNEAADKLLGRLSFVASTDGTAWSGDAGDLSVNSYLTSTGKLIVRDFSSAKTVIFNTTPTVGNESPDVSIGTTTFETNPTGGPTQSILVGTTSKNGISSDGNTKLFITDRAANRVMVWDDMPTTSNDPADFVIGQPNFTSSTADNGGIGAGALQAPSDVSYDPSTGKYAIADTSNHRVLIYNAYPTSNQPSASVVLGQPDFTGQTANNGGISAATMSSPSGVYLGNGKLIVSDSSNNRVLIWNTIPTVNGTAADVVLGQPDMISNTINNGGLDAGSMRNPHGVAYDGTRLVVADKNNQRVLIWTSFPTIAQEDADYVLGQDTFLTSTQPSTKSNTYIVGPMSVSLRGTTLAVSSEDFVLLYDVSLASAPATTPATYRSDTLSRQAISSLSNHTIAFITSGGVAAGETMTVTFPAGFSIAGALDFTDVDVSYGPTTGLESELTLGASAAGATWGAAVSGQVLTITSGSGTIPASSRVVIEVGTNATTGATGDQQITNPSSADAYLVALGGTFNENGSVAVPITQADQVTSTAIVGPSITFDIDAATSDSNTDGPHTVALGTLSSSTLSTSRTDGSGTINALFFDLTTNAVSGATVSMVGANTGLSSVLGSTTITLPSNEATITAGQERMGVCLSSLAASSGSLAAAADYDANGTSNCTSTNTGTPTVGKIQTTATPLFTSANAPVSGGRAALLFKASITSLTPAQNDYTNTITFIAIGTF